MTPPIGKAQIDISPQASPRNRDDNTHKVVFRVVNANGVEFFMRIGRHSGLDKAYPVLGKRIGRGPEELRMSYRDLHISQSPGSFTPEQLGMEDNDIIDLQIW